MRNVTYQIALALCLLTPCAAVQAQVVPTAGLATGDGSGGGCPDAATTAEPVPAAAASRTEGRPDDVPAAGAVASEAAGEVPAKSTPQPAALVRPKAPMRWHSFLPGMMK